MSHTGFTCRGGAPARSSHIGSTRYTSRGRSFLVVPGGAVPSTPTRFERGSDQRELVARMAVAKRQLFNAGTLPDEIRYREKDADHG